MILLLPFTDLDECSDPTLNNCHIDATCADTNGSFICTCNTGYNGDGTTCTGTLLHIDNCIKLSNKFKMNHSDAFFYIFFNIMPFKLPFVIAPHEFY